MSLDDRDKWRQEHPALHVCLDGDEKALRSALRAAGIANFEIAHSAPQGWADRIVSGLAGSPAPLIQLARGGR